MHQIRACGLCADACRSASLSCAGAGACCHVPCRLCHVPPFPCVAAGHVLSQTGGHGDFRGKGRSCVRAGRRCRASAACAMEMQRCAAGSWGCTGSVGAAPACTCGPLVAAAAATCHTVCLNPPAALGCPKECRRPHVSLDYGGVVGCIPHHRDTPCIPLAGCPFRQATVSLDPVYESSRWLLHLPAPSRTFLPRSAVPPATSTAAARTASRSWPAEAWPHQQTGGV